MIEAPEARIISEQLNETVRGKKNNGCVHTIQSAQVCLVHRQRG